MVQDCLTLRERFDPIGDKNVLTSSSRGVMGPAKMAKNCAGVQLRVSDPRFEQSATSLKLASHKCDKQNTVFVIVSSQLWNMVGT